MMLSVTALGGASAIEESDATDLGFVLRKHPDRVRTVDVGFGQAHVFYPEATEERCTAVLLVEVDPVGLSRRQRGASSATLEPYVNDRPYVASSLLSVAIGRLFGSALGGSCPERPELVEARRAVEVSIPVVAVRGGLELLQRLFTPLGYSVSAQRLPLDDRFPAWGESPYFQVELSTEATIRDVLAHLYVLLPVLDDRKHYWVGDAEVDKLLRRGDPWLAAHPEHELITRRYLRNRGQLTRDALARLTDDAIDRDLLDTAQAQAEDEAEQPLSLNDQRHRAVIDELRASEAKRVVDLGCGEGRLLQQLVAEPQLQKICGVDVSLAALDRATRRVSRELEGHRAERVELLHGALTYLDRRLIGYDAATIVEVIEHLDLERLDVFTGIVFGQLKPRTVIVTTPNVEYNVHFEKLPPSGLRHGDHRFEWTREEFTSWTKHAAAEYGYTVRHAGIGDDDPATGAPTQMAVFAAIAADSATAREDGR